MHANITTFMSVFTYNYHAYNENRQIEKSIPFNSAVADFYQII